MANTYISVHLHIVFSTKNREPFITEHIRDRLWSYLGGIARQNRMKALAIGGRLDHVHLLLSFPATISISQAVQKIKGVSSTWVSNTFPRSRDFTWQIGYGAFSLKASDIPAISEYIDNQEEHHRFKSFKEEYLKLLQDNGVDYDERYVFD